MVQKHKEAEERINYRLSNLSKSSSYDVQANILITEQENEQKDVHSFMTNGDWINQDLSLEILDMEPHTDRDPLFKSDRTGQMFMMGQMGKVGKE